MKNISIARHFRNPGSGVASLAGFIREPRSYTLNRAARGPGAFQDGLFFEGTRPRRDRALLRRTSPRRVPRRGAGPRLRSSAPV